METYSSILAWENPMDRGTWWATVHGVKRVRLDLAIKPPPLNIGSIHGFELVFLFSLDKYSKEDLLDYLVVLFLIF